MRVQSPSRISKRLQATKPAMFNVGLEGWNLNWKFRCKEKRYTKLSLQEEANDAVAMSVEMFFHLHSYPKQLIYFFDVCIVSHRWIQVADKVRKIVQRGWIWTSFCWVVIEWRNFNKCLEEILNLFKWNRVWSWHLDGKDHVARAYWESRKRRGR